MALEAVTLCRSRVDLDILVCCCFRLQLAAYALQRTMRPGQPYYDSDPRNARGGYDPRYGGRDPRYDERYRR